MRFAMLTQIAPFECNIAYTEAVIRHSALLYRNRKSKDGKFMEEIEIIEEIAKKVLQENPNKVVRYLLLRDVVREPIESQKLIEAELALSDSLCIKELEKEQRDDGSWGAFHSRSVKGKEKIPSTEVGVERALTLGLDSSHPILRRAGDYIINILEGRIPFPDYHEKNDRWKTGMNLFLCSTLSLIHPEHPILDATRKLWLQIAQRTFSFGSYNENDEIAAHKELTGATVKDSYLVLNSRYHVILLGSEERYLPKTLENLYIKWIWNLKEGIGYLEIPLFKIPPIDKPGLLDRWFVSHELLSRFYPRIWSNLVHNDIKWLWNNQNKELFWNFGSRASTQHYFPLSDSWRYKNNKQFDWTARVLILLRRYYDAIEDNN